MTDHHRQNLDAYSTQARKLADVYNGLSSEDVLPGLTQRLAPSSRGKRKRALDLGCGSGRDAFWLADRHKYAVTAVDGAAPLLALARKDKRHPAVTYVEDRLPALDKVRKKSTASHEKYDLFLLSAVWMHMKPAEREVLVQHMAALANQKALAYISLRHGEAPADRPMFACPEEEVEKLGRRYGAKFEKIGEDRDKQGRGGVHWSYVTLRF